MDKLETLDFASCRVSARTLREGGKSPPSPLVTENVPASPPWAAMGEMEYKNAAAS